MTICNKIHFESPKELYTFILHLGCYARNDDDPIRLEQIQSQLQDIVDTIAERLATRENITEVDV
jgi:hypothetical protein